MRAREFLRETIVLGIDDEIDVALVVQGDVLRAMPRNGRQAHALEQAPQGFRFRRGVFDELEAVGAHRVGGTQLGAHDDSIALSRTLMAVPNTMIPQPRGDAEVAALRRIVMAHVPGAQLVEIDCPGIYRRGDG